MYQDMSSVTRGHGRKSNVQHKSFPGGCWNVRYELLFLPLCLSEFMIRCDSQLKVEMFLRLHMLCFT